jgi:hypothetical protein
MRLAKLGTKRSLSAREKSSQSMKGHKWSTSTLKKRIESLRGKKRTGQAYQNILDANARAHGYKSYAEMPPNERPDWRGLQWSWTRKSIKERDDHTCQKCNRQNHLQVHHITPWRVSQDNSPKNLVTLCIWCHQSINQFTIKEQFIMFAHAIKKPLVGAL